MKTILLFLFGAITFLNSTLLNAQNNSNASVHNQAVSENDSWTLTWDENISKDLDDSIRAYMDLSHTPGLALAIVHKGKVIKRSFYGLADVAQQKPVTEQSEFWLASVSKHLTTALILDMEEDSILSRNDFVVKYLPELPSTWSGIRIQHLMSHTSGISDNHNSEDPGFLKQLNAHAPAAPDLKEFITLLGTVELSFPAGEHFIYSDIGMMALSAVAARAADQSFDQLMKERIFNPADMSSYLFNPNQEFPNQVKGYSWMNQKLQEDENRASALTIDQRIFGGAGSLFVTLDDMINWNKALNENYILKEQTKELLWKNVELNSGNKTNYGLGLKFQEYPGGFMVGHNGIAGTEYWKIPGHDLDIIILTNHGMNFSSYGFVSIVGEKLGLLDMIRPEMLLSIMGVNKSQAETSSFPEGKYKIHRPFPVEVYIEFFAKNQKPYVMIQGLQFDLIPLENENYLGFSKAIFFPGAPIRPYFSVEDNNVKWVMGPQEIPLTQISE